MSFASVYPYYLGKVEKGESDGEDLALARNFSHLEVALLGTAVGALPIIGNVGPASSGRDPLVGPSLGFIVFEATDLTHPNFKARFVTHVRRFRD